MKNVNDCRVHVLKTIVARVQCDLISGIIYGRLSQENNTVEIQFAYMGNDFKFVIAQDSGICLYDKEQFMLDIKGTKLELLRDDLQEVIFDMTTCMRKEI